MRKPTTHHSLIFPAHILIYSYPAHATQHAMLANPTPHSTPKRPLPPAKMRRRAPSLPTHPPPPYDDADADIDVDEHDVPAKARLQPVLDEWIQEKSREELSDLLLAAGGMIKERESGALSPLPVWL